VSAANAELITSHDGPAVAEVDFQQLFALSAPLASVWTSS